MHDASPDDLRQRLRLHGQEHVLAGWDRLDRAERPALRRPTRRRSTSTELRRAVRAAGRAARRAAAARPDRPGAGRSGRRRPTSRARRLGEDALRRGEVAVLVVAGGQGSRLGFDQPKGMFPVGPVVGQDACSRSTPRRCWPCRRRYGKPVPFLVMTSPATHAETEAFFREHTLLRPARRTRCIFFQQGTMPALDLATGKLLLETPGRCSSAPNGHGGTLTALADSGLLDRAAGPRRPARLLLPGGQPAGEDRRPGVPRPAHRGRVRGVVEGRRQGAAGGEGRRLRPGGRPLRASSSTPTCRDELAAETDADGQAAALGRQPGHPPVRRGVPGAGDDGRAAGCRSTSPARRCRTRPGDRRAVSPRRRTR